VLLPFTENSCDASRLTFRSWRSTLRRERWSDLGSFELFVVITSAEAARLIGIDWDAHAGV